ncbi:hypothetical protein QQS21_006040 [Conoideocrella luteorostrata]|uniref:Karyogamy protein n=1 Tax=Conoideocrella luteorostrata TaxID=1105319 RepID=A0AAJ0FTU4_9HYPO|nr:hypothetical protein QQS21_006040 [Conoideocrella luteorostrata]
MTSTQLPPLNFGGGGLRISLFAPVAIDSSDDSRAPTTTDPENQLSVPELEQSTVPKSPLSPTPTQNIPVHPIPSLQEGFSESLDEATNGSPGDKPKLRELDAQGRREALIAQDRDDDPFDAKWRFRNGQKQHELVKLIAQISFGVYLLLNGMANSNAQVVSILQGHIDEVDEFLEVALEDLSQATDDLSGRIEHLKLPLANLQVFEQLLEDRTFRLEILAGNEKIDHVITRTNAALKQWDEDIEAGLQSTAAFTSWLKDEENASWRKEHPDVADIFDAMKGNTEGWLSAFDEMHDRAQDASNFIIRLSTIIGEMEKKAGEISRRTWAKIQPFSIPSVSSHGASSSIAVSTRSGKSSRQSTRRPSHHPHSSIAASTARSEGTADINPEEDFPLPGGLPLLPPPRSSLRLPSDINAKAQKSDKVAHSKTASQSTFRSKIQSKSQSKLQGQTKHSHSSSEEPLYVLQPHTYTPQPSEAAPSPILRPATASPELGVSVSAEHNPLGINSNGLSQRRASIRTRVSQRTNPPDAIQIPPRSVTEATLRAPSPTSATPRTAQSNPFDSAYGSDAESITQPALPQAGSEFGLSPPRRPQFTHSPRSDHQQYYRPVRASPHSPLQQRPHTSVGARFSHAHLRNQPSALGGMSTLSNVTNAVYDDDKQNRMSGSRTAGGTLKKKKSAFGWFKKAFSLDEDEKAAFEARKAMQHNDRYYDPNSPKFLDGRRIR